MLLQSHMHIKNGGKWKLVLAKRGYLKQGALLPIASDQVWLMISVDIVPYGTEYRLFSQPQTHIMDEKAKRFKKQRYRNLFVTILQTNTFKRHQTREPKIPEILQKETQYS